jgi:hypothetical protein
VDGDVVQEMDVPTDVVDGVEAAPAAELPRKSRGRGRARSAPAARARKTTKARTPRARKQEKGVAG